MLTADQCDAIIAEALAAGMAPAMVGPPRRIDPTQRVCDQWPAPANSMTFSLVDQVVPGLVTEVKVLRYRTGGHFALHRDPYPGSRRATATVIQLSDGTDYDGGDLLVVDGRTSAASRARGSATSFAASDLHEVTRINSGTRWAAIAWSS